MQIPRATDKGMDRWERHWPMYSCRVWSAARPYVRHSNRNIFVRFRLGLWSISFDPNRRRPSTLCSDSIVAPTLTNPNSIRFWILIFFVSLHRETHWNGALLLSTSFSPVNHFVVSVAFVASHKYSCSRRDFVSNGAHKLIIYQIWQTTEPFALHEHQYAYTYAQYNDDFYIATFNTLISLSGPVNIYCRSRMLWSGLHDMESKSNSHN